MTRTERNQWLEDTFANRFWSKVRVSGPDDCWRWTAWIGHNGYGIVCRQQKQLLAHRVAWELSSGRRIPAGLFVCHKCDNKPCCNPAHFFLGTPKDNAHDAMRKGLMPKGPKNWMFGKRGEKHPNSTLTEDKVRQIRELYSAGGISQAKLGAMFGVTQTGVWYVLHGRTWGHSL